MTVEITFHDAVGLVGSSLIIVAYFLNQRGALESDYWPFPLVNLVGSGLIAFSLIFVPNLPSIFIEIFWIGISLYGLVRACRSH